MKYKVWYHRFWDRDEGKIQEWVLVKVVDANSLPMVFSMMQGEVWSPHGEARPLIELLGLSHTSMTVDDFIECPDGRFFRVESASFELYDHLPIGEAVRCL